MEALPSSPPSRRARWTIVGVTAAITALGAGVLATRYLRTDSSLLAVISQGDGHGRVYVGVGDIANNAGVGTGSLQGVAREGIEEALAERSEVTTSPPAGAQRGARGIAARGHFLDANIQSVQTTGDATRVQVSVVVSSYPARAYEFESSSTVTLTGASGAEGQAAGVRRAMRSATAHAVDQMLHASR